MKRGPVYTPPEYTLPFSVGIRFGDNDFHCTLRVFMQNLASEWGRPWSEENLTKANIVKLFNETAHLLYWMVQNRFDYSCAQADFERMEKYLKITKKNVYFQNEVDNYLADTNMHNGEFVFYMTGYVEVI